LLTNVKSTLRAFWMASREAEKPRLIESLGVAVGAACASVTALVGSESSSTASTITSTLAAPTK